MIFSFLKNKFRSKFVEYPDRKEESVQDKGAGNLSSKTLSSSSSLGHRILSSPFRLGSDAHVHVQSQPEATNSTTAPTIAAPATTISFTAKRTRSGTIVPSSHRIFNNTNTNDPPGTRRTRSGTLVGPLPLPLAASGSDAQLVAGNGNLSVGRTRERSGIISAGPSPLPLPVGAGARRTTKERELGPEILLEDMCTSNSKSDRADEHHSGFDYDENLDGSDIEVSMVEPYIDALYIPRQGSSPDPIDFLRLAHFQDYDGMRYRFGSGSGFTLEKREYEDLNHGGTKEIIEDELVWCIADEPPSPIVVKNESKLEMLGRRYSKGGILSVGGSGNRGLGNRNNKRRRGKSAKGKGKMTRMRFMIDGHEEKLDEVEVEPEEGEDSDDELLLGDGSTWE